MSSKSVSSQNSNQSTDKVLSILEVLAQKGGPMRLQDLAEASEFNASTVLRFITTLERRGYVTQDENTQEYSLTYKLSRIANQFNARHNPFEHVHPYLKHLSQIFNAAALVAIEQDMTAVCVDAVHANDFDTFSLAHIGNAAPLYSTGAGKLFLMSRTDAELDEYFSTHKLLKCTPGTITSKARLVKELEEARRLGYACDNGECDPGIRSISVPVFDYTSRMKAAISVTGPAQLLNDETIKANLPMLLTISKMASLYLGYKPPEASNN